MGTVRSLGAAGDTRAVTRPRRTQAAVAGRAEGRRDSGWRHRAGAAHRHGPGRLRPHSAGRHSHRHPHPGTSAPEQPTTTAVSVGHESDTTVAYTVRHTRPAESLWSIAEARLGDGNRWEEIAALNAGRIMADGSTFHADAPIRPGWTLRLPGDATGTTAAGSTATGLHTDGGHAAEAIDAEHTGDYTVQPGDSLSQIARDELGSADRYPQIFRLNEGEAQPGGRRFTNPDLIYPGQHLELPATHAAHPNHDNEGDSDGSRDGTGSGSGRHHGQQHHRAASPTTPDATAVPSKAAPSDAAPSTGSGKDTGRVPDPTASGTGRPARLEPASAIPSAPLPTAPAGQSTHGPQTSASASTTPPVATGTDQGSDGIAQHVALTAGIGALLAASLTGALGVKRILQQRRRRAGQTIAIDAEPTRLEQVLHATAEPAGVALLDTVLRTLAQHADTAGQELPPIRGVQITDRSVQLIPDDPQAQPLPPFAGGDTPGTWVLNPASPLLTSDTARHVPAPYPGLVTLGATEDGALLLADLLHTRTLLLDGDADDVLAVTRALALEAGTSNWTDHTEIITVGLGARLATLLPKGRIRAMPHLPSVAADLGALLVEAHQHGGDLKNAPTPLPWILICAGDIDADHARQLADALSAARDLPVAAVLPADDATRQAFPDAEHLPVAPDTPITLAHLGSGPVQLQRLTDDQYRSYLHALEIADRPAQAATGAWQLAEDHNIAAATPRPKPHTMLLRTDEEDTDPGDPFPALLATAAPAHNQLIDSTAGNSNRTSPEPEQAGTTGHAFLPASAPSTEPGGHGVPQAPHKPTPSDSNVVGDDPGAPEINVLGALQVSGVTSSGHGPKVAELAALIYLRPGRTADTLCAAMDPASPWSTRTLQSRLSELRSRFGTAPDGQPYLPRPSNGYTFHPGVRSDWALFQHLATQGLASAPATGIPDLETALSLVRGKPFDGQNYPWAHSVQQDMLSRIIDVAHTLATWHTDQENPDLDAARHAVLRGLDIDETAEVLYRDWMMIEWAAGNTTGIRKAVARAQHIAHTYDISLQPLTQQTIDLVLPTKQPTPAAPRKT